MICTTAAFVVSAPAAASQMISSSSSSSSWFSTGSSSGNSGGWTTFVGENNIEGALKPVHGCGGGHSVGTVKFLGNFTSFGDCAKACEHLSLGRPRPPWSSSAVCQSATWHHMDFPGGCRGHCYGRTDTVWQPSREQRVTSGYRGGGSGQGMVNSGTPKDVPGASDCALREAAWDFGKELLPRQAGSAGGYFATLYDALQLQFCNVTRKKPARSMSAASTNPRRRTRANGHGDRPATTSVTAAAAAVFYVSPGAAGDDRNVGTSTEQPFASLHRAVHAARQIGQHLSRRILLLPGVHYLGETLQVRWFCGLCRIVPRRCES